MFTCKAFQKAFCKAFATPFVKLACLATTVGLRRAFAKGLALRIEVEYKKYI